MKKNDWYLLFFILILGASALLILRATSSDGAIAEVYVDGKLTDSYDLNNEADITLQGINGTNRLIIKDNYADVTDASCPDKLCVHQKKINRTNETIVCLPNKLVIKIKGGQAAEYDSITN